MSLCLCLQFDLEWIHIFHTLNSVLCYWKRAQTVCYCFFLSFFCFIFCCLVDFVWIVRIHWWWPFFVRYEFSHLTLLYTKCCVQIPRNIKKTTGFHRVAGCLYYYLRFFYHTVTHTRMRILVIVKAVMSVRIVSQIWISHASDDGNNIQTSTATRISVCACVCARLTGWRTKWNLLYDMVWYILTRSTDSPQISASQVNIRLPS